MAFDEDKEYKPGEKCEASGIYTVTHDGHHRTHQVTVVFGEPFPPCRKCKHPRFLMATRAIHFDFCIDGNVVATSLVSRGHDHSVVADRLIDRELHGDVAIVCRNFSEHKAPLSSIVWQVKVNAQE